MWNDMKEKNEERDYEEIGDKCSDNNISEETKKLLGIGW